MPEVIEPGILYISQRYRTALHLCCCGCGSEVVTPLNPAKWRLTERAGDVSLYPSIGNWSLPCESHYWIEGGEVQWSYAFSQAQIRAAQAHDLHDVVRSAPGASTSQPVRGVGRRLLDFLYGTFKRWIA